jgi:hypothetical protein
MAEPSDQVPAATGHGRLRTSHADREHAIEMLKAAYVQGMLTKDELDARVGQALTSRTYADLAALTTDIPPAPAAAFQAACPGRSQPGRPARLPRPQPARPAPGRRRPLARAAAGSGGCRVGRLPGHRLRRHAGPPPRRSGQCSRHPPRVLGAPELPGSPHRRIRGTVHRDRRGGPRGGAETLPQAAAAPAGAGRPWPGRRPARRRRPWPGSHWSSHRPDQRGPAGPQVTAAPAACSRAGGSAPRGAGRDMTLVNPAQGTVPARLTGLGLTP